MLVRVVGGRLSLLDWLEVVEGGVQGGTGRDFSILAEEVHRQLMLYTNYQCFSLPFLSLGILNTYLTVPLSTRPWKYPSLVI